MSSIRRCAGMERLVETQPCWSVVVPETFGARRLGLVSVEQVLVASKVMIIGQGVGDHTFVFSPSLEEPLFKNQQPTATSQTLSLVIQTHGSAKHCHTG